MPRLFKGQFSLEKGELQVYLLEREKKRCQPSSKHSNCSHSTSLREVLATLQAVWAPRANAQGSCVGTLIWAAVHIPLFFVMLSFDMEGKNAHLPKRLKSYIDIWKANRTPVLTGVSATTWRIGFLHLKRRKGRGMSALSPVCRRKPDVVEKLLDESCNSILFPLRNSEKIE